MVFSQGDSKRNLRETEAIFLLATPQIIANPSI